MIGSKFKHLKSGGHYEIMGTGLLESSKEPMVIYRSLSDGQVWIRPEKEFFDGRFQQEDGDQTPPKSAPPRSPRPKTTTLIH